MLPGLPLRIGAESRSHVEVDEGQKRSQVGTHGMMSKVLPNNDEKETRDKSSDESSGEAFKRKRTAVKTLELNPPPAAGGLRAWINGLLLKACSASNRPKRRTMRYIKTILESSSYGVLETVAKKWDDFDTELGQAVMKISTGSFKRELMLYAEKNRQGGIPSSGRPT